VPAAVFVILSEVEASFAVLYVGRVN